MSAPRSPDSLESALRMLHRRNKARLGIQFHKLQTHGSESQWRYRWNGAHSFMEGTAWRRLYSRLLQNEQRCYTERTESRRWSNKYLQHVSLHHLLFAIQVLRRLTHSLCRLDMYLSMNNTYRTHRTLIKPLFHSIGVFFLNLNYIIRLRFIEWDTNVFLTASMYNWIGNTWINMNKHKLCV